jgi:hypothetical protein
MTVSAESVVQTIEAMERYFRGGFGWGRFALHNPLTGKKCLLGAVGAVRASDGCSSWVDGEATAAATWCIQQAVRERGYSSIPNFNDSRLFYGQIAAVLTRAKQLAMTAYSRQSPPPVAQVPLRSARPALTHQPEQDRAVKVTLADMERVAVKRQT